MVQYCVFLIAFLLDNSAGKKSANKRAEMKFTHISPVSPLIHLAIPLCTSWIMKIFLMNRYVDHTYTHQCHNSKLIGVAIFILRFLTLSFKHNALQMLMLTIVMGLYKVS